MAVNLRASLPWENKEAVWCPACGEDFMHPRAVYSWPTESDHGREELDFAIWWECEMSHSVIEVFRFHKGTTWRWRLVADTEKDGERLSASLAMRHVVMGEKPF